MTFQNVRLVLAELEDEPEYQRLTGSGPSGQPPGTEDPRLLPLRQLVDALGNALMANTITEAGARGLLAQARAACVGPAAPFLHHIQRAETALDA